MHGIVGKGFTNIKSLRTIAKAFDVGLQRNPGCGCSAQSNTQIVRDLFELHCVWLHDN